MFEQITKRDQSCPQRIYSAHGCKVYLSANNRFKTNTISFNFVTPLKKETVTQNSLLPMVLIQGSSEFQTSKDVSIELENCYGGTLEPFVDKLGDNQVFGFSCSYAADEYAGDRVTNRITKLLLSLIFDPLMEENAFKRDYVEQEKQNLQAKIRSRKDDKMIYALERCAEVMFTGEPYGISELGEAEVLQHIDSGSLFQHYDKLLKNSQIIVYLSGRFDLQAQDGLLEGLESRLSQWERGGLPETSGLKDRAEEIHRFTERMDVNQGKLTIGFTTETAASMEDYIPMMVANSVFGGGTHSKLFTIVRERESLAYYAMSRMDKFKGIILATAGIEIANKGKTEDLILHELQELKKGNISDFELDASKKTLVNMLKSIKDSQRTMQAFYLGQFLSGSEETIESIAEKLIEIKREQVVEAANMITPHTVYFLTGKTEE